MQNRIPIRYLLPLVGMLALSGWGAASLWKAEDTNPRFRDYASGINQDVFKGLYSPARSGSFEVWPGVTSKWNQPRDVSSTTPHQGVDLNMAKGTPVYPIWPGWIVYQSGRQPGSTSLYPAGATSSTWELVMVLDWNNNGVNDDAVYVKYDHLEHVGYVTSSTTRVGVATQIATSGDEGGAYLNSPHLHFGIIWPYSSSTRNGEWTSMNHHYYFAEAAAWNYGYDLDFISDAYRTSGNVVWVNAYVGSNTYRYRVSPSDVHVLHRRSGTSTWTATQMAQVDSFNFNLNLNNLGYATGTALHWLVRVRRGAMTTTYESHKSAYWPPRFAHPLDDPNASPAAYPYYTATTQ
jgi:murein DD-endopeptidase MepM/ murein hydrolase activator NlpD